MTIQFIVIIIDHESLCILGMLFCFTNKQIHNMWQKQRKYNFPKAIKQVITMCQVGLPTEVKGCEMK